MVVGGLRLQTDTMNRVHRTHVVVYTAAVAYVQTVCVNTEFKWLLQRYNIIYYIISIYRAHDRLLKRVVIRRVGENVTIPTIIYF